MAKKAGVQERTAVYCARVVERIIRCPRCGIKLAEATAAARCSGVTVWCRRCRMVVELEL